jgi:L-fucose isomerase-like protein
MAEPGPVLILVGTGGTERTILGLVERRSQAFPGEPVVLLAHGKHNALPAAMEALARVHQAKGRGKILFLRGPDDRPGLDAVARAAEDLEVRTFLHRARIGLLGGPSDWLVASSPTPRAVLDRWGPQVVPIEMDEVISRFDHPTTRGRAGALVPAVVRRSVGSIEPDPGDVRTAAAIHPALLGIVREHRLDALTVRCFDLLAALGTSACIALAQLNDDGTIAGCEGDLPSAVAMLWTRRLLGATPWMANPAEIDPELGTLRLAHCTVPWSLVGGYRLRTHFESGIGVGIEGVMPPGPLTLVRVGGSDLERLWVCEGEALLTSPVPDACRTQLEVALPSERLEELLTDPLGNHLVAVAGAHAGRLLDWWTAMVSTPVSVTG